MVRRVASAVVALALVVLGVPFGPSPASAASPDIVISQIYGGGGNVGATYRNDFIELFNRGTVAVDMTGWSVQYAPAGGAFSGKTNIGGILQPGQYYLVQEAVGAGGTTNLPAPDATGTIAMSATAGKVALVTNQALLTCGAAAGNCFPTPAAIRDFVGFGTTANNFEDGVPTPAPSNTIAVLRKSLGCVDNDNNGLDFATGAPNPRNTFSSMSACAADQAPSVVASTPAGGTSGVATNATISITFSEPVNVSASWFSISCVVSGGHNASSGGGPTAFTLTPSVPFSAGEQCTVTVLASEISDQDLLDPPDHMIADYVFAFTIAFPILAIHTIQGNDLRSPYANQNVTTTGVVTGVKSNGFFIQAPDLEADADPSTSEGIFVFTSSTPPASASVGNLVQVSARVQEFIPSSDPFSPPATELVSPSVTVLSSGRPLPAAITLTSTNFDPAGSISQLERYEGMRVHVDTVNVVAPTGGSVSEPNATSTSSGVFYGVLPGVARPFREPGIETPETNPPVGTLAAHIPTFDANPERIRVDSSCLCAAKLEVTTGAVVNDITGPVDFVFRSYSIFLTAPATIAQSGIVQSAPVRAALPYEFTIATANMERFFDTTDDPSVSDVALTPTAFNNRLSKASLEIRNVLRMPDVLGVEEVENLAALQALASRINSDAAAIGPNPGYVAYLREGNDIGGIDSGFLVKTSRVTVIDVTQYGKDTIVTNPDGSTALLNDRPPLVLRATIQPAIGPAFPVTVIVIHGRSLSGINGADGARIRAKRQAQAEELANLIQGFQRASPSPYLIALGDYNAFQFSDGYVDVIGTVKGAPTPADSVTLASPDLVTPDLTDLIESVPADQRYSFMFDGNAQEIDHVLVTQNVLPRFVELQYGRNNADFAESFRDDPTRPERISDHDPIVAYFTFPDQPPMISAPASVTTSTGTGATSCAVTVGDGVLGAATAIDDRPGVQVTRSGMPSGNVFPFGTTTITHTVTDTAGNTASATQTVTVTDDTRPTITAPASASYQLANQVPPANAADAIASDNCGAPTVTVSESTNGGAGSPASPLVITRTFVATDASGNTATATQTITVIDNTPPVLTVPANVSVTTGAAATSCATVISDAVLGQATATDNSGAVSLSPSGVPSDNLFPVGVTTITYVATDAAGNTTSGIQQVTVTDNTPPALHAPAAFTRGTGPGATTATAFVSDIELGVATASDNCGSATIARTGVPAGNVFPLGPTTISYTATDAVGSTASATQILTVVDDTPPTLTGAPSSAANGNGWYDMPVTVQFFCSDNVAVTSCGPDVTLLTDGAGQSVTGTATDAAGSSATATVGGINIDQHAPTMTFTGATSYTVDQTVAINCTMADALSGIDPAVPSRCQSASGPAYTFGLGPHTLTASGTDRAGNAASAGTTFTVRVNATSLCALITRFVSKDGVAQSLCVKIEHAADRLAQGRDKNFDSAIRAFISEVNAQRGKALSDANATILVTLAGGL